MKKDACILIEIVTVLILISLFTIEILPHFIFTAVDSRYSEGNVNLTASTDATEKQPIGTDFPVLDPANRRKAEHGRNVANSAYISYFPKIPSDGSM